MQKLQTFKSHSLVVSPFSWKCFALCPRLQFFPSRCLLVNLDPGRGLHYHRLSNWNLWKHKQQNKQRFVMQWLCTFIYHYYMLFTSLFYMFTCILFPSFLFSAVLPLSLPFCRYSWTHCTFLTCSYRSFKPVSCCFSFHSTRPVKANVHPSWTQLCLRFLSFYSKRIWVVLYNSVTSKRIKLKGIYTKLIW